MRKFSQRCSEKCITFPKLQQHSENTFALCSGFLFFQCIINITGTTPGAGLLELVLPAFGQHGARGRKAQEDHLKKLCSNTEVWYALRYSLFIRFLLSQYFVLFFTGPGSAVGASVGLMKTMQITGEQRGRGLKQ